MIASGQLLNLPHRPSPKWPVPIKHAEPGVQKAQAWRFRPVGQQLHSPAGKRKRENTSRVRSVRTAPYVITEDLQEQEQAVSGWLSRQTPCHRIRTSHGVMAGQLGIWNRSRVGRKQDIRVPEHYVLRTPCILTRHPSTEYIHAVTYPVLVPTTYYFGVRSST